MELYTINPGTSYSAFGTPDAAREIYLRNLSAADVLVCTTAAGGAACSGGYGLAAGSLYKDAFSGLGLDGSLAFVTFTNNSAEIVKVRAGLKNL